MDNGKKVILHIVFDGILFDRVFPFFEEMETYKNLYLFASLKNERPIKFIKNSEKIMSAETIEEWGKIVANPQVDIIYLHGIWRDTIKVIDFVQQDTIIMWWCYGREIYENIFNWPPLLSLKLFKPRTRRFVIKNSPLRHAINLELSYYFPKLYIKLISLYKFFKGCRDNKLIRLLSRINYVFTPLEMEFYELKKKHVYFKARPYVLRSPNIINKEPMMLHNIQGSVLLEHSAFVSNNHLDIIAAIKKKNIKLNDRDIYIPLAYGDNALAKRVQEEANFDGAKVHCIKEAMPFGDYKAMMDGCTHAIYGMIRQSGLGNAYLCLQKGIKMFFFKDSIMYNQFKAYGCYVFSIEDDLNNKSIQEPLSPEQIKTNYEKYYAIFKDSPGTYQQQFDKILNNG